MKSELLVFLFLGTLGNIFSLICSAQFERFRDTKSRFSSLISKNYINEDSLTSAYDELEPILDEFQLKDLYEKYLDSNDELFDEHVISKREVSNDDEALEGSGDDTPTPEEPSKREPQNATTIHHQTADIIKTTSSALETTIGVVELTTAAQSVPETIVMEANTTNSSLEAQSKVPSETIILIANKSPSNTTVSIGTTVAGDIETTTAVNKFVVHEVFVTETPKENEVKPVETDKQQGEGEKENAPEVHKSHNKEDIDQKQSGVAILTDTSDTASLEGSEKTLGRMKPNETLKPAVIDEPVPGESKPQSAKSDTKIIIFLLAGVVAVGAIAATFNYVRKKRQSENDAADRQNGSCARTEDPEEGRELKPLMKNGEGEIRPTAAVEYEDEKAEGK